MKTGLKTLLFSGLFLVLIFLLPTLNTHLFSPYWQSVFMFACINIILATSLHFITGITGQFSLGHAGFMSIGAYTSATLSLFIFQELEISFLSPQQSETIFFTLSLIVGGCASACFGFLVGLPSLRLKGDYLAIITLGFGEIIRVILLNIPQVGGPRGLPGIPKLSSPAFIIGCCLLTIIIIRNLTHSPFGRKLKAIRDDEISAEALGIPLTQYKVLAFTISSFFAGVAGGLFGHFLTFISPKTFDFNRSFEIVFMIVFGGTGSLVGAVTAGFGLTFLKEMLRPLQEYTGYDLRMVIFSFILVLLMILRPQGLFGKGFRLNFKNLFQREKHD